MGERLFCKQRVVGSNPTTSTTLSLWEGAMKRIFILGQDCLDAYDYFQKNLSGQLEIKSIKEWHYLIRIFTKDAVYSCLKLEDCMRAGRCHEMYVTKKANSNTRYFKGAVAPLCNLGEGKIIIEEYGV